jgi:septum formation protein
VLAADTIVALGGTILGKASDAVDARRILSQLSGTTHLVITGVAVIRSRSSLSLIEQVISTVEMKLLTSEEIDSYIATGQWRGKAGAYGIQDSDPFVRRMAGCLTNIVGLPITTTRKLLAEAGITARE